MNRFEKGDWVKFKSGGLWQEKLVLAVKPSGDLVVGEYDGDPEPMIIDPEYRDDVTKSV